MRAVEMLLHLLHQVLDDLLHGHEARVGIDGGPRDRHQVMALRQHPGERQLGRRAVLLGRKSPDLADQFREYLRTVDQDRVAPAPRS